MAPGTRLSRAAILAELRLAARRGDRVALSRAIDQMTLWACSPRYWAKYLDLLAHPLARLVDLTVIKQGEKIARQKGWRIGRREPAKPAATKPAAAKPAATKPGAGKPAPAKGPARSVAARSRVRAAAVQPSLFPD